jgi:glycosyltransferase involved in cell wall biosynthesis
MSSGRPSICFVSAEHPAFDKRVFEKEAVSLARAGFEVTHVCPGPAEGRERARGVEVVTYTRRRGKVGRLLSLAKLFRLARSVNADAYHCNEPDSWLVGILMRLLHGRLAVFDCHEHYPGQVVRWVPAGFRRAAVHLIRYYLQVMGLLTHLIVLAKYSVADDFSWSSRRHVVVLNTTRLEALQRNRERTGLTGAAGGMAPFAFVHIGVFRRERGSEQLLDAMRELARRGRRDYRVVLIGEFKDGSEQDFFHKADAAGVRELIDFHRWMPFEAAFERVGRCQAGLVLFQKDVLNNVYGMPHKMFDYMLAGLPVIAPDFAPDIVRVLRDSSAGLLIDTADARALADVMQRLIDDPDEAAAIGRRGQEAVFARYHWEADAATLMQAYGELFQQRGIALPAARVSV